MKTFLFIAMFVGVQVASAKDVHLAVAANFTSAMKEISTEFTKESGNKLIVSYGSTGKLYAQVINGGPFEVFLSADQEHPTKLVQEGAAVKETQFTYATGKLVLWSPRKNFVDAKGEVLRSQKYKHLAIAQPKLAPYGAAAQQVLEKMGLEKSLQDRIVFGENITQAHQFVFTGSAELGFVAYSQVKNDTQGSHWVIPQDMYKPLKQDVVLLIKGKSNESAKQFLEFLKGEKAKKIIADYGYGQ